MRNILLGAAFVALAVTGAHAQDAGSTSPKASTAAAAGANDSKAHVLTRQELDNLLGKPGSLLVIDVRRPDEVSRIGGLPVYLSIQLKDLEKSVAWIPRDRSIITVSNHAKRAATAADLLAAKGFKVAGAVGVQTYEEQGGKLTRIEVPARHGAAAQANAAK